MAIFTLVVEIFSDSANYNIKKQNKIHSNRFQWDTIKFIYFTVDIGDLC